MDVGKTGATYGSVVNEPYRKELREGEPARKGSHRVETEEGKEKKQESRADTVNNLLHRVMQKRDSKVKLTVHEPTNRVIIRVTDSETGEVIREIPREKYLDMVANFLSNVDRVHGVNLDEIV